MLFLILLIGSQIYSQTFVTTGGTVTTGYWNSTNTGGTASFIVPNDGNIAFAFVKIDTNDANDYINVGAGFLAGAQESKSIVRTANEIEVSGLSDDDTFDIYVVFTDGSNPIDTLTLSENIIVDQTAPSAFQVGSVIATGGNVSAGYWNGTNTNLEVTVPIANDGTLQNGSLQITGYVGGNPKEDLGASATVLIISTTQTITLDDTDFTSKAWFLDSQTFSLTATLSDAAGNSTDGSASGTTLSIDQSAPSISSITSATGDQTWGVGATIDVTVNFDETVTLSGGDLLTNLNSGAQLTTGAFTSTTFSETYTVSEGEDAPSLNVSSFSLSGGSVKLLDVAGNNADLATIGTNLEDNTNLIVDGSTPSISSITSTEVLESFGVDDEINITINFSEALTLSGGNLLVTLETGTTDQVVTISSINSSSTASETYTVQNGDESADLTVKTVSLSGGSLVDAGGNSVDLSLPPGNNLADNKNIAVDGAGPAAFTVSTATVTGGNVVNGFWNGTNSDIEVIVPIANDASLEDGTVQVRGFFGDISGAENLGSSNNILGAHLGSSITVTITRDNFESMVGYGPATTLKLTAILADAGGNSTTGTQSASTFVIDEDEPTISSISSTTADGTYGIGDDVNVTINFSSEVTISGGNLLTSLNSSAQLSTSSISGVDELSQTYTISALDESTDLDVSSLVLSGGSVSLTDAAGNSADLNNLPTGASSLVGSSALEIDGIVPTISSITSTSTDGSFGVDDVIDVTVTFSEDMTLTGGSLLVTLETGDPDRQVTISSISGSVGNDTYTVQSGDASDDLTASALSLSAGTLQDAGGNDVDLTDLTGVTNIDDGSDLAVDGASPSAFTVGTVTVIGGDVVASYWNDTNTGMTISVPIEADNSLEGGNVQIQAFFNDISGAVDVGSAVTIVGGDLGGNVTVTLTEGNVEGVPGYAEASIFKFTAVITDDGGNTTTGTQSVNTFTIDTTDPTITSITSLTSNGTYGVGEGINVTITFDENVTLSGGNLLTTLNTSTELSTATITNTNTLSQTYTIAEDDEVSSFSVSGLALSAGTAELTDAAGNQLDRTLPVANNIADNSSIDIDGVLPTLSAISSTTATGSYGVGETVNITLTFSETVTLSGGDLEITHDASATDVVITSISGSTEASQTYTIESNDVSSDLTVTALALSAGTLQDAGGNDVDLTDLTGISNIDDSRDIVVDGIGPTAFQVGSVITAGGTVVAGYWNNSPNTSVNVTIPIANDASLQNGSVQVLVQVGSGAFLNIGNSSSILVVNANKTVTLSSTNIADILGLDEDVVLTFSAEITDDVSNSTIGTASITTLTIDTTDPTISSITSNPATDNVGVGASADITVTFSENVTLVGGNIITSLETGDSDAALTTTVLADTDTFTETYTVSEGESSTNLSVLQMTLNAGTLRDGAGNEASFSIPGAANLNGGTLVIDGNYPTIVSISSTSSDLVSYSFGDEIDVVIEFSEALTLAGGDLLITLETGTTNRQVTISSINNSTTTTGTYTVEAGDVSSDLTVNSVSYLGATLKDEAGNDLDETLPSGANSLAGSSDFVVDGTVPADFPVGTVISTGGTVTADYWNDTNTGIQITVPIANDASLQSGSLQIQARTGGNAFENIGDNPESITSIDTDQDVSLSFSIIEGITGADVQGAIIQFTAVITDVVGNSTTGTTSPNSFTVDEVAPTIASITSVPIAADLQIGGTADITINFSEAVTLDGGIFVATLETGDTDAELTTAVFEALTSITQTYTAVEDEVTTDLSITGFDYGAATMRDLAGNDIDVSLPIGNNLDDNSNITVDGNIPTITNISAVKTVDTLGLGETLSIDIDFSEPIDLVAGNLQITLETGTNDYQIDITDFGLTTSISGSYPIQIGDESSDLTVTLIEVTAGVLEDEAGNTVDLTLPVSNNLADNNDIIVDGIVPDAFDTGDILTVNVPVVTGYWNAENTSLEIILPLNGSDASLDGGTAQLEARVSTNAFVAIGDALAAGITDKTLAITDTQVELDIPGYGQGEVIQVRGVLTDIAGNSAVGNTSAVELIIDTVTPIQTITGDIVVAGGDEFQGYWNPTNLTLTVSTDLDADISLIDGTLQLQARIGTGPYLDIGSDSTISVNNTTHETVLTPADFVDHGILNSEIIDIIAVVTDVAGNETIGLPGANTLTFDSEDPGAFAVQAIETTGDPFVVNYFNDGNEGADINVPINPGDNTLIGGSVQLRVSVDGAAAEDFLAPVDIETPANIEISVTRAELEAVVGYAEGAILTFHAIMTDVAGNTTQGSESVNQLEIDTVYPTSFVSEDIRTLGFNPITGYWNNGDNAVLIKVPIDIDDASLVDGHLVVFADLTPPADESFEQIPVTQDIASLGFDTISITIPASEMENLEDGTGFTDGLEILFQTVVTDVAGNSTTSITSALTLAIDRTVPITGTFVSEATTTVPYINAEDTLQASWTGFSDATSGISVYEYSIGLTAGTDGLLEWDTLSVNLKNTLMTYTHGADYFLNVRAYDLAGNQSSIVSTAAIIADLESPNSTSLAEPYYLIDSWSDINSFSGSYSDGLSGVDTLWMNLSRESDSLYWDGADWVSDSTTLELDLSAEDGFWNYSIASDTLSNHENYIMRLLAVDSAGNRQSTATLDTFQFIINSAPEIFTFSADTTSLEDSLFTYYPLATDPDFATARGDTLSYSFSSTVPEGMSIDALTGMISWVPVDSAVGEHVFGTKVTDLLGLQDSIINILTILNVNDAPEPVTLLLPADSTQLVPDDSLLLTFSWSAAFDIEDNPVSYELTMQGDDYESTMTTSDTFLIVDVSVMDFPVTAVEWFIHALDAEDISDTSDVFEFTTSAASAQLNTSTIAVEMRRKRYIDSLFVMKNMGLTDLQWSLVSAPSWLSLVSESGTIEYQDSSLIAFNVNPGDSTVGGFGDTLRLVTNDPLQDTLAIAINVGVFDIPTPVLALYKNPAYPGFYEMMIVDSLGMIDTLILSHAGEALEIDTVGDYSYLATIEIASAGSNSFEIYAANWVGDTTITTSISVSLAKAGTEWFARSPDQQFEVRGTAGSANYNAQLAILDTVLSLADNARYKVLSDGVLLAEPVLVSMPAAEENQAIYIRDISGDYIELPSMNDGDRVTAWAERMGAFDIGPRTIIIPERSQLSQNYPNPFNPSTSIDYDIGFLDGLDQDIEFSIYNIRGQEIRNLVNTQVQPGRYSITWNGLNSRGEQVSSGIYFARLMTGKGYVKTVKMLVLR